MFLMVVHNFSYEIQTILYINFVEFRLVNYLYSQVHGSEKND